MATMHEGKQIRGLTKHSMQYVQWRIAQDSGAPGYARSCTASHTQHSSNGRSASMANRGAGKERQMGSWHTEIVNHPSLILLRLRLYFSKYLGNMK